MLGISEAQTMYALRFMLHQILALVFIGSLRLMIIDSDVCLVDA